MAKNRYGNEYEYVVIDDNTMTIKGDLEYWRFGGREGTSGVDMNDLGFIDPSGGPFISVGMVIDGKTINKISNTSNGFMLHYEKN
jgi:hypothetical protein